MKLKKKIEKKRRTEEIRRKHHFDPYILESHLIRFLHYGSSQFGSCYFQSAVNLVPAINSLTENAYVANELRSWHTTWLIKYFNCYLKCHTNLIKIHVSEKIELLI